MRMKSAVESQFLFTTTYAALLVAYADHNNDFLGLGRWLDGTTGAVDSLLLFLPQPGYPPWPKASIVTFWLWELSLR